MKERRKRKILFVDGEPNVLQGLKRMLRSMRNEWEMSFADTGKGALDILCMDTFDVVVTDIFVPDMDGIALLKKIAAMYPQIVRIAFSGTPKENMILKTINLTHQFLSKPCNPDELKSVVTRVCALKELLLEENLVRIISKMESLPNIPSLYIKIVAELQSEDASIQTIGEIISKDLGMTIKILQLVNSAYFGVIRRISSIAHAVSYLGMDTIKGIVLLGKIFSQYKNKNIPDKFLEQTFNHSMRIGVVTKAISEQEGLNKEMVNDAYFAGLLHDVGKLVLVDNFPEKYKQILKLSKENNTPTIVLEKDAFGTTHAEVGSYLMGLWGFDDSIVEAVAFHHSPEMCPERKFIPMTSVYISNALENELLSKNSGEESSTFNENLIAELKLTDHIPQWKKIFQDKAQGGGEC